MRPSWPVRGNSQRMESTVNGRRLTATEAMRAREAFASRHLGADEGEVRRMLEVVGASSLEALIEATVPAEIRMRGALALPEARSESEALEDLRALAARNR